MSFMSRLATAVELRHEIPLDQYQIDALVALGYEPAEHITEIDIADLTCWGCGQAMPGTDIIILCHDCERNNL